MLRETFAQITYLSQHLPDPARADRAMHGLLCANLKLARRTLTKNILKKLMWLGVGTNDVEKYVEKVCKQNVRKARNSKLIRDTMRTKVADAEYVEKQSRKEFVKKSIQYGRLTNRGSFVDVEFKRMMKYEVEYVYDVYDAADDNVAQYGGVQLSEKARAALKINPKFMTYSKIDELEIEVEIEKGCTKARYSWMSNDNNNNEGESDVDGTDNFKVIDLENKVADYANVKVTDIPTVQRLFPPKPATLRREVIMQNIKDKMLRKVEEFKASKCNDKGWIKDKNISKNESDGLKEVGEKIKNK